MEKQWAIIKDGYVIDVTIWDKESNPNWTYPAPHDAVVESPGDRVMIGDWYESAEGVFYRPLTTPPDFPSELVRP